MAVTYNPDIDWQNGTMHGDVIALTKDVHQWSSNQHKTYDPEDNEEDPEDQEYEFIPSNERNVITINKTTTATELAAQATDQTKRTWQEQVPEVYHQFGRVFSDEESTRFPVKVQDL